MTGCADCDEWVRELAVRAEHPAGPAVRHCPTCGRDVVAYDIRPSDRQEAETVSEPKKYTRDRATGRYGRLMPELYPGSRLAFLRPVDGGVEWTTDVDNLDPCDADGRPLDAKPASSWYARIVDGRQTGVETAGHAASLAGMSWVTGTLEAGLTWTSHDPGTRGAVHIFRLEPISDTDADDWRARHPRTHEETDPCDA